MFKGHMKTGTQDGTGAAINISLGFKPMSVTVNNVEGDAILTWTDTQPAASGMKTVANGTTAQITSNGISLYAGTADVAEGFTLGTDGDVNADGEAIHWIAIGSE